MKFHGDLTLEKFYLEWFGMFGREIGTKPPLKPNRKFTDNPNDLIAWVKLCEENKSPVWSSAQPFSAYGMAMGIEKVFLDFDDDTRYCPQCKEWHIKDDWDHLVLVGAKDEKKTLKCVKHQCPVELKPRKDEVGKELKYFLNFEIDKGVIPLVVETNKGYHVHLFLPRVYTFQQKNLKSVKEIYKALVNRFLRKKYRYIDSAVKEDMMRMARVPLTRHEVSGEICKIIKLVGEEFVEDKVRSVSHYRSNGILVDELVKAVETAKEKERDAKDTQIKMIEEAGLDLLNSYQYSHQIRPCFEMRMKAGEMTHSQRLAFLLELYYNGYRGSTDKETEEKLASVFRENFHDFEEGKTMYYIRYFLDHEPDAYPPYKCETLENKGWCLGMDCPKWRRDHNVNK